MAKRGGKMKTSTKVALGAGAAAVGGIGYLLWSRWKKQKDFQEEESFAAENTVEESTARQRDSDDVPIRRRTDRVADLHREATYRASPSRRPAVDVTFVVKPPKVLLHIDEKHYKGHPGSKLLKYFSDGQVVSYAKAMGIIRGQSTNKGPPNQMYISGTDVPVQIPRPPDFLYYKKVVPGDTQVEDMLKLPPYMIGGMIDFTSLGFKKVAMQDPEVKLWTTKPTVGSLKLPPGEYTVITPMRMLSGVLGKREPFIYLKNMWQWTKNGPRTRSCEDQRWYWTHDHCSHHMTSFGRTMYYSTWDDVVFVVTVPEGGGSVVLQPMFDIGIGKISYYENDYSKKIGRYCRMLNNVSEFVDEIAGFDLREAVDTVAGWAGC